MSNSSNLKLLCASSLLAASLSAHASNLDTAANAEAHFNGTFQTVIKLNSQPISKLFAQSKSIKPENLTDNKIITLMRLAPSAKLTQKAETVAQGIELGDQAERNFSNGIETFDRSETATDLSMSNVPVLDQGQYGTCVTFATTAAIDAILDKGDFIDQQCTLALNLSLGENYWDGAYYASQVLLPLQKYGAVEKGHCPAKYPAPRYKLSTNQYKSLADTKTDINAVNYKYNSDITVNDVETALSEGHRVAIGFMLKASMDPVSVQGFDVTINGQKRSGGLWACKQPGSSTNYCGTAYSGHEVVITGYDDTQKLFKIRNSWSADVADEGDFYMTYEFFNAMAIDGTEIW